MPNTTQTKNQKSKSTTVDMGNTSSSKSSSSVPNPFKSKTKRAAPKITKSVLNQKLNNAFKTKLLSLSEHRLTQLPAPLLEIVDLKSLDLKRNKLGSTDASLTSLCSFAQLKTLHLDQNDLQLGHLPPSLAPLTKLQVFTISDNPKIGQSAGGLLPDLPPSLKNLDASWCRLSRVPPCLHNRGEMSALVSIILSGNEIVSLPDELYDKCPNLAEINLKDNSVFRISSMVGKLKKLKALDLSNNRLSSKDDEQCLASQLFAETTVIDLTLTGNDITLTVLNTFVGFDVFLDRRTKLKKKDMAGGALTDFGVCGL